MEVAPRPRSLSRRAMLGVVTLLPALSLPGAGPRAGESLDLTYHVSIAGVRVARASFVAEPRGDRVVSRLDVRGAGLGALLSGTRHALATVAERGTSGLRPVSFDSREIKRDRTREITIRYEAGEIVSFVYLNRGRSSRSDVPEKLRHGTVDPLTAVLALRDWLKEATDTVGARSVQPVFDGRRRFDLSAEIRDTARRRIGGRRVMVHELKVQLLGLHGFDADDTLVTLPGAAAERWLSVQVEALDDRVPLVIESRDAPRATVIELADA